MAITSAIVLFAVIWFMVLFIVLPLNMETQGERGEVVPGTHASAPANLNLPRKVRITTIWAAVVWAVIAGTILSGVISIKDLDYFQRMSTPDLSQTN